VGVLFAPLELSLTVAVHVLGLFTASEEGEQAMLVAVACFVPTTASEPLLAECFASVP
jgi:hypothetical protein